jgi:hypothetical protein
MDGTSVFDLYLLDEISPDDFLLDSSSHVQFDDSDDEFSFEELSLAKQEQSREKRKREAMRQAGICELVSVPARNEWVTFEDMDALRAQPSNASHPLVLDDDRPTGMDNYVYYDHRHDDEYDSNAEDHEACDYPDESDSDVDAGYDSGECHGQEEGY